MQRIAVAVQFETDRSTREYRDEVEVDGPPTVSGEQRYATELFEYARVELTWDKYRPDVTIANGNLQVSGAPPSALSHPTQIFDRMNTSELWREIQNTLYDVAYCLAQAKAYKEVEPKVDDIQRWYPAHARKLFNLNAGALYLAKIQDLVVRLLFENFGGSQFINVDITEDDWEAELTMKNARRALKRLLSEKILNDMEYEQILAAINEPGRSSYQKIVVAFRNCVAHRIRPSVDHTELSPLIQDRVGKKILDNDGELKGTQWTVKGHTSRADFEFADLYIAMVDYLVHVKIMLEKLKAIPRFS